MKDPAAIINNIRGIGHVHRSRGARGPMGHLFYLIPQTGWLALENVPSERILMNCNCDF